MGKCAKIYVVPPKDLRKKEKTWRLLRVERESSVCDVRAWRKDLTNMVLAQTNAVVPCLYWCAMLEALGVHWRADFIFGIPDDRADDLEQLIREVLKVKICERIGPGFF